MCFIVGTNYYVQVQISFHPDYMPFVHVRSRQSLIDQACACTPCTLDCRIGKKLRISNGNTEIRPIFPAGWRHPPRLQGGLRARRQVEPICRAALDRRPGHHHVHLRLDRRPQGSRPPPRGPRHHRQGLPLRRAGEARRATHSIDIFSRI